MASHGNGTVNKFWGLQDGLYGGLYAARVPDAARLAGFIEEARMPTFRRVADTCLIIFFILSGAAALRAQVEVRSLVPIPKIPGYTTLKADLHQHAVFSDGRVWPTTA